jgi:hypothetical protein
VFVDGVLIPVRCLLNGATIVQEQRTEVTYFHVELPAHEVILAEGLPCESYLDLGNRGAFDNGGGALLLHPDFAARLWQRDACAELILGGPKLAAARRRLIVQAAGLGHAVTDDPAPQLRVGRRLLRPERSGLGLRFLVPVGARSARLLSRTCIHADVQDGEAARRRGVAVSGLLLDRQAIDLADSRLGAGWYPPAAGLRWTDGDARIALCGAREILLILAPSGPYWARPLDDPRLCSGWHVPEPQWRWTDGDAGLRVVDARELAFDVVMTGSYWKAPAGSDEARVGWR